MRSLMRLPIRSPPVFLSQIPLASGLSCHRGEGAGKKIVRYLIGCALERIITKIYLETSPCGRALYEAAGFSEMRDMMLLTYGK